MSYVLYAAVFTAGFWLLLILLAALFGRVEKRLQQEPQSNVTVVDFQNNVRVRRGA